MSFGIREFKYNFEIPLEDLQAIGTQSVQHVNIKQENPPKNVQEVQEVQEIQEAKTQPTEEVQEIQEIKEAPKEEETITIKYTDTYNKTKPNFGTESNKLKVTPAREITYKELSKVIAHGGTFLSAEYKDPKGDYNKDNIKCIPMLALDIDYSPQKEAEGKEKITMQELTQVLKNDLGITPVIRYPTFSDTDNTSFRLIYKFEKPLNSNEFEALYKCMLNKYPQYLDPATKNSNRLWAGTRHKVIYNDLSVPITEEVIKHLEQYKPVEAQVIKKYKPKAKQVAASNNTFSQFYIKAKYKEDISKKIIKDIDIVEYLSTNFNWSYKVTGNTLHGCCPLHGGDCKTSFVVFKDTNTYTCYSDCNETGNVLSLAYKYYNVTDFSYVALMLCEEYGIEIPINAIEFKKKK